MGRCGFVHWDGCWASSRLRRSSRVHRQEEVTCLAFLVQALPFTLAHFLPIRDSSGFSSDVCAILQVMLDGHFNFAQHADGAYIRLIANITRCFFWLGSRFELPLLYQSILMIVAQVRPMRCRQN